MENTTTIIPLTDSEIREMENHIAEKEQHDFPFEFSHTTMWNSPAPKTENTDLLFEEIRQIHGVLNDIKGILCELTQPFEDVDK